MLLDSKGLYAKALAVEIRHFTVVDDPECIWSDGLIGGYCCEMYVKDLEIGNLVHTLGHSVDVGFGLERLVQVLEGKTRVHETSLFRQELPPLARLSKDYNYRASVPDLDELLYIF